MKNLMVEKENPSKFADAINYYLSNPEKAVEIGKNCKKDLLVRLSWDAIAESLVDVYREVCK